MGAGLEIVHLVSPNDMGDMTASPRTLVGSGMVLSDVIKRLEEGAHHLSCRPLEGGLIDGLLHVLKDRCDILSVVIGRPVSGNKRLSGFLKRLGCPVIIPDREAA